MCVDLANFITNQDLLTNYICPIGKGFIIDPVYLNCSSSKTIHVFCKECIETYEKKTNSYYHRCPVCSASYNKIEIVPYYENVISKFELKCENDQCEWSGTVEDYRSHSKSCEKRYIKCPNKGCIKEFVQTKLNEHVVVCEFLEMTCEFCQSKYINKDKNAHSDMVKCPDCEIEYNNCLYSRHKTMCEHRQEKCYSCYSYFKQKDKINHQTLECPERYLKCDHCGSSYQFKLQNDERFKQQYYQHKENKECEHCLQELPACCVSKHILNDCEVVQKKCEIEGCNETYTKKTHERHMSERLVKHLMLENNILKKELEEIKKSITNCYSLSDRVDDKVRDVANDVDTVKNLIRKILSHFNISDDD